MDKNTILGLLLMGLVIIGFTMLNSPDDGNKDLVERITSRRGTHILYHAALLGAGSRNYQLIDLDHE